MDLHSPSGVSPPEAQTRPGWSNAGNPAPDDDADGSPTSAFKAALANLGELKEYVSYFLAAKLDGVKVSFRNLAIYAVLGIIGLIAGGALVVTAIVLLCLGLSHALGALLHHTSWAGDLVVGLLLLGGIAAGVVFGMKALTGTSHKNTVKKYETRQRDQRINYGHDVHERAESQA